MASSRLTGISVGCLKNATFTQARAGILGPVSQDPRLFKRDYDAGDLRSSTSTRIIVDPEFDNEPEFRNSGGMPLPEPATTDEQVLEVVAETIPEKPQEAAFDNLPGSNEHEHSIAETVSETLEDAAKELARDKPFTCADERPKIE